MASIEKRGEVWRALVHRKGYPTISLTAKTEKEVKALARLAESEMDRGIFIDRSNVEKTIINDLIDRFKKEFAPFHYKKRADEKEAWRFQCDRLSEKLGKYSLANLNQDLVAKYRDDRLKEVAPATVRKELYLLSKILGFAEKECGIDLPRGNPVLKIRIPADGRGRNRRLTDDQFKKLLEECQKSRNKLLAPITEIATETAMRQGEILKLKWYALILDRSVLIAEDTKNGEDRYVPLSDRTIEIFESIKAKNPNFKPDEKIFSKERLAIYHAFKSACKRAEIADFTFHDLRHEALSRLAERGDMNLLELAEFSGHKTLQMLKKYTHLRAEMLAEKLNGIRK